MTGSGAHPEGEGQRVLLVEDERDIAALLAYHLARAGYGVRTVAGGMEAMQAIRAERPDLVVLDVMLPEMSGYDVLAAVRRTPELSDLPVILLTARREEADRVRGLELGADDYVTKPFSPQELVLRVVAVLRRAQSAPVTGTRRTVRAGEIDVDLTAMRVFVGAEEVQLTPTEYRLLVSLIERRGRVQSRRQLLQAAWGVEAQIETRTVDMHVQRLRNKLGVAGGRIETVRGFGYRINTEGM